MSTPDNAAHGSKAHSERASKDNVRDFSAFRGQKTWWFRKVEGWVSADPMNPNNGRKERVLIVWRKLTGNLEEDNLMLDEWFKKYWAPPKNRF